MSPTSISNSKSRRKAFAFLGRMILFALPVFLLLGMLEWILYRTGETRSIDHLLQIRDQHERVLFGNRFIENHREYQWHAARSAKADILILGSSRVGQIRAEMFPGLEDRVYNAGMSVYHLGDLHAYTQHWRRNTGSRPKVLILGIDPTWLTQPAGDPAWQESETFKPLLSQHVAVWRGMFRKMSPSELWETFAKGAGTPADPTGEYCVGMKALLVARGMRRDGSYQYQPQLLLEAAREHVFRSRGNSALVDQGYLDKWSQPARNYPENIAAVMVELNGLRDLGIEVDVVIPPLADVLLDGVQGTEAGRALWRLYSENLIHDLREAGYLVVDGLIKEERGRSDLHMVDMIHPGELLMADMVAELLERCPDTSLLKAADIAELKQLVEKPAAEPLVLIPWPGMAWPVSPTTP